MSSPLSGQKIVRPVRFSPQMIGQLMELGPRWWGSSDGWYWIVPRRGRLQHFLRHEQRHVSHHAQVAFQRRKVCLALPACGMTWAGTPANCGPPRPHATDRHGPRGQPERRTRRRRFRRGSTGLPERSCRRPVGRGQRFAFCHSPLPRSSMPTGQWSDPYTSDRIEADSRRGSRAAEIMT